MRNENFESLYFRSANCSEEFLDNKSMQENLLQTIDNLLGFFSLIFVW